MPTSTRRVTAILKNHTNPRTGAPRTDYTLATLSAELRKRSEGGEDQGSILDWLRSLMGGLGVRINYELLETPPSDEKAPQPNKAGEPENAAEDNETAEERGQSDPESDGLRLLVRDEPPSPSSASDPGRSPKRRGNRGKKNKRGRNRRKNVPVAIVNGVMHLQLGGEGTELLFPPPKRAPAPQAGRVVLSCDRRVSRYPGPICTECNGAVLDAKTWSLLAVPPRAFTTRPSPRGVNANLAIGEGTGAYDVIQVRDGTVVTIYSWDHPRAGRIWCLGSSNGYDVSNYKWMGPLTYAEVLSEALSSYPGFVEATGLTLAKGVLGKDDVRLGFTKLDPGRSYTVGFRHHNFHPLRADPMGVWNIQSTDLETGEVTVATDKEGGGLHLPATPAQKVYTREEIAAKVAAAGGAPLEEGQPLTMADLEQSLRSSLQRGLEGKAYDYGYILRSRDSAATGRDSEVLCESPLLRRVRQLIYQRPSRQVRDSIDENSRLEYNALRAYLSDADRGDFRKLFPQYENNFTLYGEFAENVIHLILHRLRQTKMNALPRKERKNNSQTQMVANALLSHIKEHIDLTAFNSDAKSIVRDYVVQQDYTILYLRAIGLTTPE